MENRRNYYRILHVQPDAPREIIRASYRTLMQRLRQHPDLGGKHWNARIINEAFDVLMDDRRRAQYDQQLFAENTQSTLAKQHPGQRDPEDPWNEADSEWRPFRPTVIR